jgi:hypothetical protein
LVWSMNAFQSVSAMRAPLLSRLQPAQLAARAASGLDRGQTGGAFCRHEVPQRWLSF